MSNPADVLNVHFSNEIFTRQKRGGISRYFSELIYHLAQVLDGQLMVGGFGAVTANVHLAEHGLARSAPAIVSAIQRVAGPLEVARASVHRLTIVHQTFYSSRYRSWKLGTAPQVFTVFDMIPELFPESVVGPKAHLSKMRCIQDADLIFCISETTRRDVVRLASPVKAPLVVTPLGVSPIFSPRGTRLQQLGRDYLLFVGNRSGYKDFAVLAKAFSRLSHRYDNLELVAVGGGEFSTAERAVLTALSVGNRVKQLELNDEQLAQAYTHALCLVSPSRYEGFGLPTLEAMACGCPVVLADADAHLEVAGAAAAGYFPAGDEVALAACIERVLQSEDGSAAVRAAGRDRARGHTWSHTASLTAAGYESLRVPRSPVRNAGSGMTFWTRRSY